MIRRIIIEFILPLILFFIVRSMFKGMASSVPTARQQRPEQPPVPAGGELKKDPVCGTYVSTSVAVSKKAAGETVYFCSAECRDRFKG